MTRFGVPSVLVFDNAAYFSFTLLTEFALDTWIIFVGVSSHTPRIYFSLFISHN
jgi:hypothetical protein